MASAPWYGNDDVADGKENVNLENSYRRDLKYSRNRRRRKIANSQTKCLDKRRDGQGNRTVHATAAMPLESKRELG